MSFIHYGVFNRTAVLQHMLMHMHTFGRRFIHAEPAKHERPKPSTPDSDQNKCLAKSPREIRSQNKVAKKDTAQRKHMGRSLLCRRKLCILPYMHACKYGYVIYYSGRCLQFQTIGHKPVGSLAVCPAM